MPSFYFAYGSNMDTERLRGRAPGMRPRGRARLVGWRLAFDKRGGDGTAKANIHPAAGALTWGVVYACSEDDLRALDRYEGVSAGHYRRERVVVIAEDGRELEAITYVAEPDFVDPTLRPATWYLEAVLRGAREHGLGPEAMATIERAACA
ncbi:MAG: gamma-glutamylcyclotransferase [Planctomycetota bacterium]|nr:MAG: gamma-glutamylcyclotransferase [Planctomycetota bacterium]